MVMVAVVVSAGVMGEMLRNINMDARVPLEGISTNS